MFNVLHLSSNIFFFVCLSYHIYPVPRIALIALDQSIDLGARSKMFCTLQKGTKPISFEWFYGDQPLSITDSIKIVSTEEESILTIADVVRSNAGTYMCKATNAFGFGIQSMLVTVKGIQKRAGLNAWRVRMEERLSNGRLVFHYTYMCQEFCVLPVGNNAFSALIYVTLSLFCPKNINVEWTFLHCLIAWSCRSSIDHRNSFSITMLPCKLILLCLFYKILFVVPISTEGIHL